MLLFPLSLVGCPPPPQTNVLSIHFIDVGQGDAILIDMGQTEVLIDGGSKGNGADDYISAYVDGALEVMVATHPHEDHIGGLGAVLEKFEVKEVWLSGETSSSKTFTDFINLVNAENATVHMAERGGSIAVGSLIFSILNPPQPLTMDTNNNSIVLRLSFDNIDFLFMGDAEKEAEQEMLPLLFDIEVLKVGHHGSSSSSSAEFLNVTRPEVAIYMAGVGNKYGHPHQETIDALKSIGARIYGTDVNGTIIITTDGETYQVKSEK